MDVFADAFVRNEDGSWLCRRAVHFVGPQGPMSAAPGVTYRRGQVLRGYDIAQWLDDWRDRKVRPVGIRFLR